MPSVIIPSEGLHNPVDVAELVVMDRDWSFDRLDDGELVAEVNGTWCNYRVWFTWQEDLGGLTLSCSFETKLPRTSLAKVHNLLAQVNEKLWIGHFEVNSDLQSVMFRHSLLLTDGSGVSAQQLKALLDIAIQESERFFPAFQSVVWGGRPASEALEIALFDTVAEA